MSPLALPTPSQPPQMVPGATSPLPPQTGQDTSGRSTIWASSGEVTLGLFVFDIARAVYLAVDRVAKPHGDNAHCVTLR